MVKNIKLPTILFTLLVTHAFVDAQLIPISKAWAKNSINTVIFRKNSVVSFNNQQYVAYYDSLGYVVLAKRKLRSDNWIIRRTEFKGNIYDAHCSISIMVDGDGYLHMAWNHHNSSLNYCRSKEPESLALSDRMQMTGILEDQVSYPEFYKLPDGNLIFLYRDGGSGKGNLVINKYNKATKQWLRLHDQLIDGQGERNAYWQTCIDTMGTIHISWVWRESPDVSSNHDICYAKSMDGGITWLNSNHEKYSIPITASTAEYACRIPQGSNLINQTSISTDSKGTPYIASYWSKQASEVPQYFIVFPDKGEWKIKQASNRKTAFSLSNVGTKKIPISRPQLLIDETNDTVKALLIYRDDERKNRVSMNICPDIHSDYWYITDLTDFSVGSWEPTYDSELWKNSQKIHLFVMYVGQGDNETIEEIASKFIYILNVPSEIKSKETFK